MGTKIGHTAPGFGFFVIGLWHLFNHTRLYAKHGSTKYRSLPWFPSSYIRHLELYLIMLGTTASVSMELFIGPQRHQPFDPDGTIPSNHLHNFEHSSISLSFLVYSIFALILDKSLHPVPRSNDILQVVGSIAFAQQLLLFHLHSADHMGVEGQYHWLLQLLIFVSLCTTILSIGKPKRFFVSYVRSLSIIFQGVWLIIMGFMLWTPSLIPKGCFMHLEAGHKVVRCDGEESLVRARSLVNIEFSWCLIGLAVFALSFYVLVMKFYRAGEVDYMVIDHFDGYEEEEDLEAQQLQQVPVNNKVNQDGGQVIEKSQNVKLVGEPQRFIQMSKGSDQHDHVER